MDWLQLGRLLSHLSYGCYRVAEDGRSNIAKVMDLMAAVLIEDPRTHQRIGSHKEVYSILNEVMQVSGFTTKDVREAWEVLVREHPLFEQEQYSVVLDFLLARALPVWDTGSKDHRGPKRVPDGDLGN